MTPKKMRPPSSYTRQVLALMDEYEATTGDRSGDLHKMAEWLDHNGKMVPPAYSRTKALAKMLAIAARQDYIENEKGEPVRRRHCYILSAGESEQSTFSWFKIEDATPDKMKLSVNYRRNGTLRDILQLVRDVNYFNAHHNPGEPIPVNANFQSDIDELSLPTEYQDEPSDDPDQS